MYWIFQFFRRFGFTLFFKLKFFRWNGHQFFLWTKLDMVRSQKPKIAIILWTNFQNITKKTMGSRHWILHNNHIKTHLFFQFLGGGTLFSSEPGLKGGINLKTLWRSHLTCVRRPISYRIPFMARRSFFVFLFFFH